MAHARVKCGRRMAHSKQFFCQLKILQRMNKCTSCPSFYMGSVRNVRFMWADTLDRHSQMMYCAIGLKVRGKHVCVAVAEMIQIDFNRHSTLMNHDEISCINIYWARRLKREIMDRHEMWLICFMRVADNLSFSCNNNLIEFVFL